MKKKLLIFFYILYTWGASAQSQQENAQTQYEVELVANAFCKDGKCEAVILALSGLKLRNEPSFSSKTIAIIPFAQKVTFSAPNEFTVYDWQFDADSIRGFFQKVNWDGKSGYVFSAYLGTNIIKMEKPFYVLDEYGAWCWDDSYISPAHQYYGVYPNKDSTQLTVKKRNPIFYTRYDDNFATIGMTFKQKQPSLFAFASKEPFEERSFAVNKTQTNMKYDWETQQSNTEKIKIPGTDWELRCKNIETKPTNGNPPYKNPTLIIQDEKSGKWNYLVDENTFYNNIRLLWVGDMDGDGVNDFMLNVSSDHSGGMMLFLSKNPGKWRFVKLAGLYFWGDCC